MIKGYDLEDCEIEQNRILAKKIDNRLYLNNFNYFNISSKFLKKQKF